MPDKFTNKAYISVATSAIDTLTFGELETGVSMFEKQGWIINQIEYFLDNAIVGQLVANTDSYVTGLTLSNKITAIDLSDSAVVDMIKLNVIPFGTPGNGVLVQSPIIHDFSKFPGGGLIIPPRPIYGAVFSGGFSAVITSAIRFHFTVVDLKDAEYWELVEAYRLVS